MSENKNNGLNEFNKRNIEERNRRLRRRSLQKAAVITVFVLLIAIVTSVLWLVILDISENVGSRLPSNDPAVTTDGNGVTTPLTTTDPSGTTNPGDVTSSETTPGNTTSATPEPSFATVKKNFNASQMHSGSLILVNQEHPFVTPTDMESKLDIIKNYKTPGDKQSLYFRAANVTLLPSVSIKLFQMTDASLAETKINDLCLSTNGAYRTFDDQQALYAAGSSKFPGGCSDYNTGLAVYFIGWADDGKTYELDDGSYANGNTLATWFESNAYKYGFIKRFQGTKTAITGQPEAVGMYRYVGYVHAYNMKQQNLCLEEYLNAISKYTFEGEHYKVTADDGNTYEIYYVPSAGDVTSVPVPESLPYEISGDNIGGFIVTVTLD